MRSYPKSSSILARNKKFIPGGVVSLNRSVSPEIAFVTGSGAYIWDADGNRYIDYHAAFAAHLFGHNDEIINEAVERSLRGNQSLFGSGTTIAEGRLAELICTHVPSVDSILLLNTGSEATYQAIRAARAITGRSHIIVMQGGYNGWHNDVCCNLMTPLQELGPRVSSGEYPFFPISAGIPEEHRVLVHPVNFNDAESVDAICSQYPIACLITEPILQNVGIIQPRPGYLTKLRKLADQHGFLLILDEVKTGFRHGLGGYASIAGVRPDFTVFGKAVANGYPMAVLGGRRDYMDSFVHPDRSKRVLLAGTYNGHPVPVAAAIATIERLARDGDAIYNHLGSLGSMVEQSVESISTRMGIPVTLARQGSAFCIYFMDHAPTDWHDLASHHNFDLDARFREQLIERGIYFFPVPVKQSSISTAHTAADIDYTLAQFEESLTAVSTAAAGIIAL